MSRRIGKKYSVVKIEGRDVVIRISDCAADGPFFAWVDARLYKAAGVEELVRQIQKVIVINVEKVPMIAVYPGDHPRIFNLSFERYFIGEHPFHGRQYFSFDHPSGSWLQKDDVLEGVPGRPCSTPYCRGNHPPLKLLPYTPALWLSLVELQRQFLEMRNRVEELLSGENAEAALTTMSVRLIENKSDGEVRP